MARSTAPTASPTAGCGLTRIWYPPPSEDCTTVTAEDVIAAAAEEGIPLTRRDPHSSWLVDDRGRTVFWWLADDTLVLRTFPHDPNPRGTTNGIDYSI